MIYLYPEDQDLWYLLQQVPTMSKSLPKELYNKTLFAAATLGGLPIHMDSRIPQRTLQDIIGVKKVTKQRHRNRLKGDQTPDTVLEVMLTYLAGFQKLLPELNLPDEEIVQVALDVEKDKHQDGIYWEETEERYFLPEKLEKLPESERPAAALAILQEIKSSSPFLKNLSLSQERCLVS